MLPKAVRLGNAEAKLVPEPPADENLLKFRVVVFTTYTLPAVNGEASATWFVEILAGPVPPALVAVTVNV